MSRRGVAGSAIVVGSLAGAVGWWLPWVLPERGAAALVLLGLDLGEFWKFTQEWRTEALFQLERELFFLPPALAAMILALWAAGWRVSADRRSDLLSILAGAIALPALLLAGSSGMQQGWSGGGTLFWLGVGGIALLGYGVLEFIWARNFLLPLLFFLSIVILPPLDQELLPLLASFPQSALSPQFAFQFYLAGANLLVILLIPLWQRLGERGRRVLVALLALAGGLLPPWALWRTWLVLQGLYGGGALPGPGVILSSGGFLLAGAAALYLLAGQAGTDHHGAPKPVQRRPTRKPSQETVEL